MRTGETTAASEVGKMIGGSLPRLKMADTERRELHAGEDPYDSEEYQEYVAKVAKTCDADDKPCDSCLAGGMCDGPSEEREDDEDPDFFIDWQAWQ